MINVSHTIDIGKTLQVSVDVGRLPESALEHVIKIGLRNILMDSHAGVNTTKYPEADAAKIREMSLETAMKKLEAMYRGEIRSNATTREASLTPVEKEARRLAREYVAGLAGKFEKDDQHALNLRKMADILGLPCETTDEQKSVFAAAIKRRAARADVIATAEKNVAEAAKLNTKVDVEL